MSQALNKSMELGQWLAGLLAKASSFLFAAILACALTINTAFYEAFPSTHLGVVLLAAGLLYVLLYPRVFYCREFVFYALFVVYMFAQLLWTENIVLGMNTLEPSVNFVIILVLFGTLAKYHNLQVVLAGILGGVLAGALIYTGITGFPFVYPPEFSYNAMGMLYFFGLFITLMLSSLQRSKWWLLIAGLLFASLIVATTSIKTNLGVFVGAVSAFVMYFGVFRRALARNLIPLLVLFGTLVYLVASNEALIESLKLAVFRISLGIDILQAREDIAGYSGFEERSMWAVEGIKAWAQNPVFGYGVEAFRSRFGITSHSTPIDLLYNSGLIGFVLFYSMFLSIMWRLISVHDRSVAPVCAVIFGALVCILFITMAGAMNYSYFLAVYIAISVGILRSYERQYPAAEFPEAELRR